MRPILGQPVVIENVGAAAGGLSPAGGRSLDVVASGGEAIQLSRKERSRIVSSRIPGKHLLTIRRLVFLTDS
ncbi:MAG: hypothetical protein ABIL01_04415 [Pseudomonadota bacterium]